MKANLPAWKTVPEFALAMEQLDVGRAVAPIVQGVVTRTAVDATKGIAGQVVWRYHLSVVNGAIQRRAIRKIINM